MASRLKEDEKNEKIIRGLSKLPANRRCINCNSQGTQYVCTNFATFICINCSGIHREFTHRVKSISMAKFTPQEITALQEGGNERAKGIYFKGWNFERQVLPDSSNIDKLRDFIKHIYVDQRFVGERTADKPPVVKVERENSNQERTSSPPYDSEQISGKDKATAVNRTSSSSSDNRKEVLGSTSQAVKEDPVAAPPARILEPPKLEAPTTSRSPASVPNDRIQEPPKLEAPSTSRSPTSVAPVQSIKTESNIKDISTQNPPAVKMVSSISLIDFDSDPEPFPSQKIPPTSKQNGDVGWASFDTQRPSFPAVRPSGANHLETSLVRQQASGPVPGASYSKMPIQNNIVSQNNASLFPTGQHNYSQLNGPAAVGTTVQSWGQTAAPNIQTNIIAPSHAPITREPHQFMNRPGGLPMSFTPLQGTATPASPNSGRRALPEDLFSMVYAQPSAPRPGWQSAAHIPMGYTMQFPTPYPGQQFAQPVQSTNPFDASSVPKVAHASTFPSMSSMQGALPNLNSGTVNHSAFSHASSTGSFGAQWIPQTIPPLHPLPSHTSQYSAQSHTNNAVQLIPNNTYYPGNQMLGGYGAVNGNYGLSGMNPQQQQLSFRNQQPGNASMFPSVGGNPFA